MDGSLKHESDRFLRRRRVPPRRVRCAGSGVLLPREAVGDAAEGGSEGEYWRKPHPLGRGQAIESVGTVASPLLAGFSLGSVVLIADDAANFRWPSYAMLALTLSALFMVASVQAGYSARLYLWSHGDAEDWWPEMKEDPSLGERLRILQNKDYEKWEFWADTLRRTYHTGILALLSGLALALPPPGGAGGEENLRWTVAILAVAGVVGEAVWIVRTERKGRKELS